MCNQEAGLSRCLTKVQESIVTEMNVIQGDRPKGKSSSKLHGAAEELDYLIIFNRSIAQAMALTMQDLPDGVMRNIVNLTLAHRDSYLEYLNAGINQDTSHLLELLPSI